MTNVSAPHDKVAETLRCGCCLKVELCFNDALSARTFG